MSETKRIATAYLPSGKELKFVYDDLSNGTNGCNYLFEGAPVAFIPFDVPIIFEPFREEHKIS